MRHGVGWCGFIALCVIAAGNTVGAAATPGAASTQSIDVVGCNPVPAGIGLASLLANTVRVSYVTHSGKAIRFVQFEINSGGVLRHASDAGLRRKGDVVEHELVVEDGALRARVLPTCTVDYVLFNDGTTYGERVVANAPEPQTTPVPLPPPPVMRPSSVPMAAPIVVTACEGRFDDPSNNDYDITVGVTFENASAKTADVVKFGFQLVDPFGKVLQTESGTMYGLFSPRVTIEPRKAALADRFLTQPTFPNSPAWSFSNFNGHDVNRILCIPLAAHFTDGSTWNR
ncbi:MAG TPA: hypothetical protein VFB22_01825 [Candidatus Baltobacteraceae bacterium]|nr:hypothetical protein [Candidatus Baltobacteraceae bacterium]